MGNNSKNTKVYIIIPIYNISIEKELLGKVLIDDYCFISKNTLKTKDKSFIPNGENNQIFELLDFDIRPTDPLSQFRNIPKYCIFKEIIFDETLNNEEIKNVRIAEARKIDKLLFIMRIAQKGDCIIGNFYMFSEDSQSASTILSSTPQNPINFGNYNENKLPIELYECTLEIFESIKSINDKINKIDYSILGIASNYLSQYYSSNDYKDKILKLAIIFESTLLNEHDELSYRLKYRTSSLIKNNVLEIMNMFYKTRSIIVHSGDIKSDYYSKIKKYLDNLQGSDINDEYFILYYFVKKIESIIRISLINSLDIIVENNFHSFGDVQNYLDEQLINTLNRLN